MRFYGLKLKYEPWCFWKLKDGPSSFYLWKFVDDFCFLPTPRSELSLELGEEIEEWHIKMQLESISDTVNVDDDTFLHLANW